VKPVVLQDLKASYQKIECYTGFFWTAASCCYKNIVVYANETDGREVATLCDHEVAEGAMHYYLGHDKQDEESLCLTVNLAI